jgi:hypothetical protein
MFQRSVKLTRYCFICEMNEIAWPSIKAEMFNSRLKYL